MHKILVTGADGLVASRFCELYNQDYILLTPSRTELDILNRSSIADYFALNQPDVVLHCAAFTNVTKAEQERDDRHGLAWTTNVQGTQSLLEAAQASRAFFIHISTDGVFSATQDNAGPYAEDAAIDNDPNLVSWYGWTKAEAERLFKNDINHAIVRISNPVRKHYELKKDYVHKILDLFDRGLLYPMLSDQYVTLTYIDEAVEAFNQIIQKQARGIFHVSSRDIFTPYELASYVIKKARGADDIVQPISMAEFVAKSGNAARYPHFGGLKVSKTEQQLGLRFRTWREIVDAVIQQ